MPSPLLVPPDDERARRLTLRAEEARGILGTMCRNIRVLHNFEPPTTPDEMRAAALQYVRKVSGTAKPSGATQSAFDAAVDEVTRATERLLAALPAREPRRTREAERDRARARWSLRVARMK
jgi:hypothetical protein